MTDIVVLAMDHKKEGQKVTGWEYAYAEEGKRVTVLHGANVHKDAVAAATVLADWLTDDPDKGKAAVVYEYAAILSQMTMDPDRDIPDRIATLLKKWKNEVPVQDLQQDLLDEEVRNLVVWHNLFLLYAAEKIGSEGGIPGARDAQGFMKRETLMSQAMKTQAGETCEDEIEAGASKDEAIVVLTMRAQNRFLATKEFPLGRKHFDWECIGRGAPPSTQVNGDPNEAEVDPLAGLAAGGVLARLLGPATDSLLQYDDEHPASVGSDFMIYKMVNGVKQSKKVALKWKSAGTTAGQQETIKSFFFVGKGEKVQKKMADHVVDALQNHVQQHGLESIFEIEDSAIIKTTEGQRLQPQDMAIILIALGATGINSDREFAKTQCINVQLPDLHMRKQQVATAQSAYHKQVRERVTAAVPTDYWRTCDLDQAWEQLTLAETAINGVDDLQSFPFMENEGEAIHVAARVVVFLGLATNATEAAALLDPLKNKLDRIGAEAINNHFLNVSLWYAQHGFWQIDQSRYRQRSSLSFKEFLNENTHEIADDIKRLAEKRNAGGTGGKRVDLKQRRTSTASAKLNAQSDLQVGTAFEIDAVHHRRLDKRVHAIAHEMGSGKKMYWMLSEKTGLVEPPVHKNLQNIKYCAPPGACFWHHGFHGNKTGRGCTKANCDKHHSIKTTNCPEGLHLCKITWGEVIESQAEFNNFLENCTGKQEKEIRVNKNGRSNKGRATGAPGNPWETKETYGGGWYGSDDGYGKAWGGSTGGGAGKGSSSSAGRGGYSNNMSTAYRQPGHDWSPGRGSHKPSGGRPYQSGNGPIRFGRSRSRDRKDRGSRR